MFLVWLGLSSAATGKIVLEYVREGAGGFNKNQFRLSPTLAFANSYEGAGAVLTNQPEFMFYLGKRQPIYCARKRILDSEGRPADARWAAGLGFATPGLTGRLVWFNRQTAPEICTFEDMNRLFEMKVLRAFADGTVYEIRPRAQPAPATSTRPE